MTIRDPAASTTPKPVTASVDATFADELSRLREASQVDYLAHVEATSQPAGTWLDDLQSEAPGAVLRDVVGAPMSDDGEIRIDVGSPSGQTALTETLIRDVANDIGFDGVHLAGVGEGRAEQGYDPREDPSERDHLPHGGDHVWKGLAAMTRSARDQGLEIVTSVAVEGLAGASDMSEESLALWPVLAEFFEMQRPARLSALSIEKAAIHSSPPVWSTAHNERSATGRCVQALNHSARDTSAWHPHGTRWPGMTADQLNRSIGLQVAACVAMGCYPIYCAPPSLTAFAFRPGDGEPVTELVRQAHDALTDDRWIAPYLRGISAVLPITDLPDSGDDAGDDAGGFRDTTANPMADLRLISPRVADLVLPPGLSRYSSGGDCGDDSGDDSDTLEQTSDRGVDSLFQVFNVPCVLAGAFRKRGSSDVVIVLVNWTSSPASWHGKFVPEHYGWTPAGQIGDDAGDDSATGVHYRIDRLVGGQGDTGDDAGDDTGNPDTTEVEMASGLSGPQLVDCSGTQATRSAGGAVLLGQVPAYRIQAYRFRQE